MNVFVLCSAAETSRLGLNIKVRRKLFGVGQTAGTERLSVAFGARGQAALSESLKCHHPQFSMHPVY